MMDAKTKDEQRLTDEQINTHSVTFLLAGYETTSTALSYVTYLLALHPTIQHTLQQHIDNYFHTNPVSLASVTMVMYITPLPRKHLCTMLLRTLNIWKKSFKRP